MTTAEFIQFLLERFLIEWKRRDRSGVYGFIQRLMAYNSNKIEGSTLTEEQTASLFDTGTLPKSDDYYRAKDVEEMNGHFLAFNKILETIEQPLSQELIKPHWKFWRSFMRAMKASIHFRMGTDAPDALSFSGNACIMASHR